VFCNANFFGGFVRSPSRFCCQLCLASSSLFLTLIAASGTGVLTRGAYEYQGVMSGLVDQTIECGERGITRGAEEPTPVSRGFSVGPAQDKSKGEPLDLSQESARTKAIRAWLDEAITIEFPKPTALEEVLDYIKKATKRGPKNPGIPIYTDVRALWEVGSTLCAPVTINERRVPLKVALDRIGDQLGFAYLVKDDVLIISSPAGITQEMNEISQLAKDASVKTRELIAKLEKPIPMRFDTDIPLRYVLTYIKTATKEAPNAREISIVIVPRGLEEAKLSLESTVVINLDGVPLKTSLRLVLKQLGLAYVVKEGRLIINTPEAIRKIKYTGISVHPI
jgi:hypothetical protein